MSTISKLDSALSTWVPSELDAIVPEKLDPEIRKKAEKGDRSVLPEVNQFLDNPAAKALYGDVGRLVLQKWVKLQADGDLTWQQGMLRFASDLRTRLAGANPSALDWLLAERVVLAWVFLNYCDLHYVSHIEKFSIAQNAFHSKRIEMANRNLLSACRTLAKVQKRHLPDLLAVVNVNVPGQEPKVG
ncbi:MAG: hypothetical protein ACRC8S_04675 [Fimbriiglobus sp.]